MKFVEGRGPDFDFSLPRICVSCGNEFFGKYCNRCGEQVIENGDKSVVYNFLKWLDTVFSFDNRLIRTVNLIARETGQYSINHMNGVRVAFVKPVAIFLIVNLLYFLFPVYETFHAPLRTQMHFLPHNKFATVMVDERMETDNATLADFTIRYDQHSNALSRMMLILFVVLAAFPIGLINYTNHLYFADHLTVSFEYNTVLIFLTQLLLPWCFTLLIALAGSVGVNAGFLTNTIFYTLVVLVCAVLLFLLFEKRVYHQSGRTAWLKALLVLPGLFIALEVYRIILFYVTMWTL